MGVVADVVLTVTVVAIAPGAVTKFQFRIGYICPTAYSAAMVVGHSGPRYSFFFLEGDRPSFFLTSYPMSGQEGEQIQNILACK